MERNNLGGSEKRTGKDPEVFLEPENDNEGIEYTDLYRDLTDLTSQVRMISDSLAACRQMSKCRTHRQVCNVTAKNTSQPKSDFVSAAESLSGEERSRQSNAGKKNVFVSYMVNDDGNLKEQEKSQKFDSQGEILTGSHSGNRSDRCLSAKYCQKLKILSAGKENSQDLQRRSSKIGMYDHTKVDTGRMIEIIERELKTLMKMTPPVALLVTALSDTVYHCKECSKCSENISTSLPWILNRVQKLIKYVTIKRHGTYFWPNDYSYLRLVSSGRTIKETEGRNDPSSSKEKSDSLLKKSVRELGTLKKVHVTEVLEDRPGIQIVLKVQPETNKKKFFDRATRRFLGKHSANFPVVHLKEPDGAPLVQVLKPSPKLIVFWDKRKVLLSPKELCHAYRQVFVPSSRALFSFFVLTPVIKTSSIQKASRTHFFKPIHSYEEQILQLKKSPITVVKPSRAKLLPKSKDIRETSSQTCRLNENKSFTARNLFADAPEIVQDLLKEAEEEKMQIQNVKELESEVKVLKDLMLEVHKNQMELSKILLEKGVYSQPIIKLTDPNMLDEENQTVKKVAEVEGLGKKSSVKTLQTKVDDLKQKCTLKNRMIVTLLKGLQSNVPKEWWEEIVTSMFDESKPIEEFDPEKISEFIRQSSLFLMDNKEASRESLLASRSEEQQSEEEPIMKNVVGADVQDHLFHQDKKLVKIKSRVPTVNLKEFLDNESSVKILAFPMAKAPEKTISSIRKLENQVSLLNMENERLWHEIHDLKGQFKDSMKELNCRRLSHARSTQQLPSKINTSGKTINLTIQIAQEKELRRLNYGGFLKTIKIRDTSSDTDSSGISKTSRLMKEITSESLIEDKETDSESCNQDHNPTTFGVNFKSERRLSENDLSYLDDLTSTISTYREENEKLRALLREKASIKESNRSMQKPTAPSLHFSTQDVSRNLKPVAWVPSNYVISEASGGYQAGPSRRSADVRFLLQNPSQTELTDRQSAEMSALMANERELQTIPEHDHAISDSSSSVSRDVSQIIQQLRTRVRSIHKDVTVLKSKNDRIDKMLDRLMDDAAENNKNFEEMGNSLNNLKNRLG